MVLPIHIKKTKTVEPIPKFWTEDYLRLFISHLSTDKLLAQNLKISLENYAITGFVAHSDIEPTRLWQSEIELALNTCDSGLALLSADFHESKWTDQEIGILIGQDKLIIPVRMGLDPYGFIGKYQAIGFSTEKKLSNDIFEALIKNEKTKKQLAYALMKMFEESNSYAESKINFKLIKKIEYWDDILIERLEKSPKGNSQIRDSFGLQGSIDYLVDKLKK
jgi:hypothetical protein